ncbi:MAG: CehA/McbA family metallohydrolase [Anaerolineales bacterium]|nr:CehA/McbA family metallohydrolase [Anaerolineales bacterium]MCB9126441.1 CehA/McbA family metallohydrolase [Ardenticatenales bacterium]MCB9171600.1 CehA/McbA family metallohydrolase [Ardenticatenales bacterium]
MSYTAAGALHMHTFFSDGTGSVQDLVRAAKESGLHWIWITDHDDLRAKPQEGYHDGLLVLVGYEITPRRNHYLVGDTNEIISRELPPAGYIDAVRAQGALGIIAHPDERVVNEYTEGYEWEDWSLRGFDGIELWNYMSDWIQHYTPLMKYRNFFLPRFALAGPTAKTLAWWDGLQVEGARPSGVFGVDAHAHRVHRLGREWTVYPYRHCFDRLTNYLQLDSPLSRDFDVAAAQVWAALRAGRNIMANRIHGEATHATFEARNRAGDAVTCGQELPLGDGVTLNFTAPRPAELRLIRNGETVATTPQQQALRFDAHLTGHYRVEAWRGSQLWLMTNHVHVV